MKLTIIKNPFERNDRIITDIEPNKPVLDLVKPYVPDCKYEVILDDHKVSFEEAKTLVPKGDQTLAIVAVVRGGDDSGGKDIGQLIASIVVAVFANWAYGAVKAIYGVQAAFCAAMGVAIVGGYLMQMWFGVGKNNDESEKTYDWGSVKANDREGGAIQMTYGTIKVGANGQAQIISQYITYDGTKQYLNILLCGGEGPCKYEGTGEDDYTDGSDGGNCMGISNIKINDNPITNYEGIQVFKRAGLNNQTKIPNFDDSYDVKSVSYELSFTSGQESVWRTDQTNGIGKGLEVVINFPSGLYRAKDDGSLRTTSVTIQLQYKLSTASEWTGWDQLRTDSASKHTDGIYMSGDWTGMYPAGTIINMVAGSSVTETTVSTSTLYSETDEDGHKTYWTIITVPVSIPSRLTAIQKHVDYFTVSAAQNEPLYVVKRLDDVTEGQYDIRMRCISKSGTSTTYINMAYWISLATITYDDFTRPNKILLAIRALATDQLSGSANITWTQTRSKVWVWVPDIETVPWGAGSYQQKNANNPAWACYDILHGCYRLYNINTSAWEYVVKRIPANKFLYADFKKWADFCDSYNITCAYFINETQTLWDALSPLEIIGRGKICQFGTKIGVMCNFPGDVVQKFSYSNIILESFQGEFVGQSERANALEVSFLNSDRDFKRQYFPTYGDDYNEVETVNPTSIYLKACSSLEVAWRYAQYQLRLNKYIYRSAKWQCGVDSISCRLGDVVAVSTPKWGVSGRIVNVGDNWIEVEKTIDAFGEVKNGVERTPGVTYVIKITLSDDSIISKTVGDIVSCAIFGRAAYTLGSENGPVTGTRIYFTEAFANDRATATYVDNTSFSVEGDLTINFPVGKTDLILYAGYGDFYQATVSNSSYDGTKTTVVCDSVPADIYEARWAFTKPEQYNLYSFGTDGADSKLFRLTRIERHDDMTATLSGLEYIPEVYEDDTEVPDIESGADMGTVMVSVSEHVDLGGDIWIDISWLPSRKIYYGALVYVNGVQVAKVGISANSYSHKVTALGTYIIKIVTLDYFENPFVTASKTYTVVGETAPGDIIDLDLIYKNDQLYLTWPLLSDPRTINYEVRKGADINNAQVLGKTTGNEFPIMGDGTYWVASYYRAKNGAWKSVVVENSLENTNIVIQYDEINAGWLGTCDGTEIKEMLFDDIEDFDSLLSLDNALKRLELSNGSAEGYYTIATSDIVDVLSEAKCTIMVNLGKQEPTGTYAIVQINVGNGSGTWAGWANFDNGKKYVGRYFNFRIKITSTTAGTTPVITTFGFIVDMPDITEYGANVLIPAEKITITYKKEYHSVPSFIPFVLDATAGDGIVVTNKTLTSADVEIYNGGTLVSRYIDYHVRGI